jgi:FO synthase
MATADEPDTLDLARAVAAARLLLGPDMNLQIPPNLSPSGLALLLESGINDFGGISPLTPDYVNPEAPWPHITALARSCASAGYELIERLPIYPEFIDRPGFLDPSLAGPVAAARAELAARRDTSDVAAAPQEDGR